MFPVTAGGGTFTTATTAGGSVTVLVPAGAVSGDVGITVVPATTSPADAKIISTAVYDFGPDGTVFPPDKPLQVTIAYNEADLPAGVPESDLRIQVGERNANGRRKSSTLESRRSSPGDPPLRANRHDHNERSVQRYARSGPVSVSTSKRPS